jgi:geranylgeranyl diphosphate synthase type II
MHNRLSFNDILQRIEREIAAIRFDNPPDSLYAPISYILSLGGKRIRPALALLSCNIYRDTVDDAIAPALCLEMFHNFTLLHDDLMDRADKRRNKPTVHKVWNDSTAILSGDAMLIVAYRLMAESPAPHLKELLDMFTATALQICGGQQYDMEFESRTDVTEAEYLEMVRLKTAVLFGCSLKAGAITGGASIADAGHLYDCGVSLGMAFQLQDDLLDVYGDRDTLGKNIGGDILCNKKTYLLVQALKHGSKRQKEKLLRWFGAKGRFDPAEKIAAVRQIYDDIHVKEMTMTGIEAYYREALLHLAQLDVPEERLAVLKEASGLLLRRKY